METKEELKTYNISSEGDLDKLYKVIEADIEGNPLYEKSILSEEEKAMRQNTASESTEENEEIIRETLYRDTRDNININFKEGGKQL